MVRVHVAERIATITVEDCAALTTHCERAGQALRAALLACDERDDVKAVVLRATGPDFAPPPATHAPPSASSVAWRRTYAGATGIYQAFCFSKKVTIVAVRGLCTGAGSMLTLCADLAVAAPDTRFHAPFAELPEANFILAALTLRLGRAKAWLLDPDPLDAEAALRVGLVNRVAADPIAEAMTLARAATRLPLDGIAMSKLAVETYLDAQSVGQDFDLSEFHAAALSLPAPAGDPA